MNQAERAYKHYHDMLKAYELACKLVDQADINEAHAFNAVHDAYDEAVGAINNHNEECSNV